MAQFVTRSASVSNTAIGADSYGVSGTRVGASLSTISSGKGHVLIGCSVANTHSASVTVDVALVTDGGGAGLDTWKYLVKSCPVPVGGNVQLIDGKVVIDSDSVEIHATCSVNSGADIIVSVLENA
jgi:hypothetical protein